MSHCWMSKMVACINTEHTYDGYQRNRKEAPKHFPGKSELRSLMKNKNKKTQREKIKGILPPDTSQHTFNNKSVRQASCLSYSREWEILPKKTAIKHIYERPYQRIKEAKRQAHFYSSPC